MKTMFDSIDDFKNESDNNADLKNALTTNPIETIQGIQQTPALTSDIWIYRIVVSALGVSIVIIATRILMLMASSNGLSDSKVPTILTAIGSGAIGALAGLLSPTPKK